ncbi:MAG: hypothetical protein B6D44_16080 [Ignavibacteriales bacterium UTCHB2]|jgi:hypothetical protein|nr:MAG: hypothetical protein B6D44_16080 [Ignavibacteriales bacterium UTCHB2]
MKDKLVAVAYNLRNLLWRTEELKVTVEKEAGKNKRRNIYEILQNVNNLMSVLKLAEENIIEIEEYVNPKTAVTYQDRKVKEENDRV